MAPYLLSFTSGALFARVLRRRLNKLMVRVLLFVSLLLCMVNAFHMASSVSLRSAAAPVRSLPVVASAELEASIKKTTSENKIVLYSKSYCPFCVKTKVRGGGEAVNIKMALPRPNADRRVSLRRRLCLTRWTPSTQPLSLI